MRRRIGGRVRDVVRLRAIFSPPNTIRHVSDDVQPALCPPRLAPIEVRPHTTAGGDSTRPLRHPLLPRIHPAVIPDRISNLTPPITRRPARLRLMAGSVSAVGCIGLFGGDANLRTRGARNGHHPRLTPTTRGLNHAPRTRRICFSRVRISPQSFQLRVPPVAAERCASRAAPHL